MNGYAVQVLSFTKAATCFFLLAVALVLQKCSLFTVIGHDPTPPPRVQHEVQLSLAVLAPRLGSPCQMVAVILLGSCSSCALVSVQGGDELMTS